MLRARLFARFNYADDILVLNIIIQLVVRWEKMVVNLLQTPYFLDIIIVFVMANFVLCELRIVFD